MQTPTRSDPLARTCPLFIDIRDVRKQAKLTQSELAQRLHTRQSVISRWEKRQDQMALHSFIDYVMACGFYPLTEERMVPIEEAKNFTIANPGHPMTWINYLTWQALKDVIPEQYSPDSAQYRLARHMRSGKATVEGA